MKSEPIRTVLIPVVLLALAAAGQAWATGADTRAIVLAVVAVLVTAAQEYARSQVTPTYVLEGPYRKGEAGYSLVEVLIAAILLLVFLVVLLWALGQIGDADAAVQAADSAKDACRSSWGRCG